LACGYCHVTLSLSPLIQIESEMKNQKELSSLYYLRPSTAGHNIDSITQMDNELFGDEHFSVLKACELLPGLLCRMSD